MKAPTVTADDGPASASASEYQSLAMLECFVHLDKDDPPADPVLAMAEIPDALGRQPLAARDLPANWRDAAAPPVLSLAGQR
jgi:hypothetical protein